MKNILSYIEEVAKRNAQKTAIGDEQSEMTYEELIFQSKTIGSYLKKIKTKNEPIAVLLDKTPQCVAAFLGVAYSGNFYVVLDTQTPAERLNRILETLHPRAILTDDSHMQLAEALQVDGAIENIKDALEAEMDEEFLGNVRAAMVETDPLYALYTSGSTGLPKGTVISHRAVIAYTQWVIDTFDVNTETIFGSQTPFYFSMSITDLYGTLRTGARLQIIPKEKFAFPLMLVEYMNTYKINTIYWVPSALCIVANWKTFAYAKPEYLQKVLFAGEVMPNKQLNYWRKEMPDLFYANLFGPTETTDICSYYVVNREFRDEESLPIGRACDNCGLLIVDENGKEAAQGELLVKGPFLANGYYNNPEKTKEVFIQNPLNTSYPEIVYKTGDLVTRNELGEILYMGRIDFQIKHAGYRIELGEIESSISAIEQIQSCVCVYDGAEDKIILIYQGKIKEQPIADEIHKRLPSYMHPNVIKKVKAMPFNANGKIDRNYLKLHYKEL